MQTERRRSTTTTIGRRALAIAATTIGLVTVVAGGSVARAAAPVEPVPPADVTVQCASDVPDAVELTAVDAVDGDVTGVVNDVKTDGASTHEFVIERTWTFTNEASESSSVSQTITVADTTPPVFDDVPDAVTVVRSGAIPTAAKLSATDNCDGAIQSGDPVDAPDTPLDDRVITRTWNATDAAGNAAQAATQTITVIPAGADLEITVDTPNTPVVPGATLVYTVTVENLGPDTATDVEVTSASVLNATTQGCTNDPAGGALCSLGDLDDGDTATFLVNVVVPSNATGNLLRSWSVSSSIADPDPANNTADSAVTVTTAATMSVTATVVVKETSSATTTTAAALSSSALAAGDPVDITITVGNEGPAPAANATVQATFTSNIDNLVVVDDGLYTCAINARVLSCALDSHPANATVVIKVSGALTGSSADVFLGPVTADSANSAIPASTTSIIVTVVAATPTTTVPAATTTTSIATTTTAVATTTATTTPAGGGSIPATGSDSGNLIRVSIVALLVGLAAVVVARRRPDLVAALRPSHAVATELPTRRVTSNGVSTVIEEPTPPRRRR